MKDKKFDERNKKFEKTMSKDVEFKKLSQRWFDISLTKYEYPYHFTWLGRPIIQYPQDILIIQELIWKIKPDLVIETGIARGGSLIFTASILELIGKGNVIGIDVDIRKHNREENEKHPISPKVPRDLLLYFEANASAASSIKIKLNSLQIFFISKILQGIPNM